MFDSVECVFIRRERIVFCRCYFFTQGFSLRASCVLLGRAHSASMPHVHSKNRPGFLTQIKHIALSFQLAKAKKHLQKTMLIGLDLTCFLGRNLIQ